MLTRTKDDNDDSLSEKLSRRMEKWLGGEFNELIEKSRALNQRIRKPTTQRAQNIFHSFEQKMTAEKQAMHCADSMRYRWSRYSPRLVESIWTICISSSQHSALPVFRRSFFVQSCGRCSVRTTSLCCKLGQTRTDNCEAKQ